MSFANIHCLVVRRDNVRFLEKRGKIGPKTILLTFFVVIGALSATSLNLWTNSSGVIESKQLSLPAKPTKQIIKQQPI